MSSNATRAMELHKLSGLPLSWCLQAARNGGGDVVQEKRILRQLCAEDIEKAFGSTSAVTWNYPTGWLNEEA